MESAETVTEDPSVEPSAASDINVHEVEQRLRSLKRDLEEYTESDLEGVMIACLSVWQDLKCGDTPALWTSLSTEHRLMGSSQNVGDLHPEDRFCTSNTPTTEFDRHPSEVKRKRPSRGSSGQKQDKNSSQTIHHRAALQQTEGEDGPVSKTHMDDAPGKANGTYKRTVSLKEVISAFNSWRQKQSEAAASYFPSLPPMPEDPPPQVPQSQPMELTLPQLSSDKDMDIDCRPSNEVVTHNAPMIKEEAMDDRPAMEVYVMPSGYIVQSARMVLQQKQAAAPPPDSLNLYPLFRSLDDSRGPSEQTYIPVRSPLETPTPMVWLHVDVKLTVSLMSPRTETFDDRHMIEGIDVTSFLSRMEMQQTPLHPLPSETIRPTNQILDQVVCDVLDVNDEMKSIKNGSRSPEGSKTSTASPLPSDIEALLQRFDERMEKL